jgi:hypothetical protein
VKVQETSDKQTELNDFLGEISPSLKKKIQSEIFTTSISNNKILASVIRVIKIEAELNKVKNNNQVPLFGHADTKILKDQKNIDMLQ